MTAMTAIKRRIQVELLTKKLSEKEIWDELQGITSLSAAAGGN